MIKKAMDKWKEIVFIFMVAGLAFNFYAWQTEAAETAKKVKQFEETFDRIASIAEDLKDPNRWLRDYLINHGIDSATAKTWSLYSKEPVNNSGIELSIPFLNAKELPEMGVFMLPSDSGYKVLDTLWDFKNRVE